ncbi:RNA polymerase sigma factor [Alishewanella longhuensis]|uniref:RNA polymerase sigma factor n=1 Tax=Alishewanella longhuensis TaxID=1091037 RepID=A0ABQ3KU56_9ALTE|nr:sigma-70 family RNA polymerase sigma factor [Alishewanella longhuensis]GHG60521.1 RNA polymerase sigma factor [Alishewanella longhuensis]
MEQSQQQLLQWLYATSQGNKEAFANLYKATSGKLFSVCIQLLRRNDWAEDVLQDAYVKIWHNAGEYHADKGNVMTWMISITRYRALDLLKSRRVKLEQTDSEAQINDQASAEALTGEQLGLVREKVKLDDCMSVLSEDHRISIQLAYFNGLSHQEITEHTGTALGSVKSWIRRGLVQLKRCLES